MFGANNIWAIVISSSMVLGITGCSPKSAPELPVFTYTPPVHLQDITWSKKIHAAYDTVWSVLIETVSSNDFTITTTEKASGRIVLSFGGRDISRYVDCGSWKEDKKEVRYTDRNLGFSLHGKMIIRLKQLGRRTTQVSISACYSLWEEVGNEYLFQTNDSATIRVDHPAPGTIPTRTCQPTHAAERSILESIGAISSN